MPQNFENKVSNLNTIPKKLISLFSRAIAKILLKFNISKHEYNHCLNEQLVLEAQKQNPDASKVELSVRTGIDRRYISGYLKGEMPAIKSNKLTLILSDLKWTLNKYFDGGNKIPKKGPFRTFESICEQWSSGTLTYKAILNELERIGSVVDHGEQVELVDSNRDVLEENIQYFDVANNLINRMSNTIIFNLNNENITYQHYQMSAFSTQIPPENINKVKQEVKQELRLYFNNIIDLLEKHEKNVKPDTYPAYGVSFLEFKDEESK